jgi:hypothetical protein
LYGLGAGLKIEVDSTGQPDLDKPSAFIASERKERLDHRIVCGLRYALFQADHRYNQGILGKQAAYDLAVLFSGRDDPLTRVTIGQK